MNKKNKKSRLQTLLESEYENGKLDLPSFTDNIDDELDETEGEAEEYGEKT